MSETDRQPIAAETPPVAADYEWQDLMNEVKAEAEAQDVTDLPKNEREASLWRYLRRRQQISGEIDRVREQTAMLIRRDERRLQALDYVYRREAEQIVRELIAGRKAKSVQTPFGKAGFRSVGAKVDVMDEAALVKAAESNLDYIALVKVETKASRSAIAEYFRTTGEVPAGCEVVPAHENFYVG